jgi:hypothetical protein
VFKTFLLASVVGFGVLATSNAFAEQVAAPASSSSGVILLADLSAPTAPVPAAMGAATATDAGAPANDTVSAIAKAPMLQLADNTPAPAASPSPYVTPDPNWDAKLGTNFFTRLVNYYKLEWDQAGPPPTPGAPDSRRKDFPPAPVTSPPYPFTEWPYGGATGIATNRTASYDSPLDVALEPTFIGKAMAATGIQAYGWVDYGGNLSTSKVKSGGNAPAAYLYNPNSITLDQAVMYVERTPDTVQTDHVDWGFRASAIYGTNYRYTTSYGLASYQLLKDNHPMGYDFPMMYLELYVPKVLDGLFFRLGRYISVPDIEAQLAPNNYMYTHSITYTFDNYTNEGLSTTLLINKNWTFQVGISVGTEATVWNLGVKEPNLDPGNPLYGGKTFLKDPGAQPSITSCLRWEASDAKNAFMACEDAHNNGVWGYNNLQWQGFTYYHKWADNWHTSFEMYDEYQLKVPNLTNPVVPGIIAAGGTPFSPQYLPFNAPAAAECKSSTVLTCTAQSIGAVQYTSFQPDPLDNISLRTEIYDDEEGQRTGTNAVYYDVGIGWQHWVGPQIEIRPEVVYYWASKDAYNGNANAGIAPNTSHELIWSGDIIMHF